jgi:hypothetical protein
MLPVHGQENHILVGQEKKVYVEITAVAEAQLQKIGAENVLQIHGQE